MTHVFLGYRPGHKFRTAGNSGNISSNCCYHGSSHSTNSEKERRANILNAMVNQKKEIKPLILNYTVFRYHSVDLARRTWMKEEGKSFRLKLIKKGDEIIDRDQFKRVSDILEIHLNAKNPPVKNIYAVDCPHLVRNKKKKTYFPLFFIFPISQLNLK